MIFNYYSRLVFITIIVPLAVQIFGYMRKVVHSPCSPFLRRLDYLVQTFGYIWTIYFYLSKFMDISGLVRFVQVFGPFLGSTSVPCCAITVGCVTWIYRIFSCDGAEITEEYVVLSLDPDRT